MPVSAEIRLNATARKYVVGDQGNPAVVKEIESVLQFASGVGANQADMIYADDFTIAASGSGNYDLTGVLTDALGVAFNAAEVVAVVITAAAGNTNNVVVGGATNAVLIFSDTTDKFPIKPGGFFAFAAPNANGQATVTAATGDILGIGNSGSGTEVSGSIWILARTA